MFNKALFWIFVWFLKTWIRFVNRRDLASTRRPGVCAKHFEEKFLKVGIRATLLFELPPVPSIYSGNESLSLSVMPT